MVESASDNRSVYRLRWVGYGLLIFALIDAIVVLTPLQLTNPVWELQAIGTLVERVAVPLLGLALVFFGEFLDRRPGERIPLAILSWLCLLLAILYLMMIPLGILDTNRLNNQQEQQFKDQLAKIQQFESQLNQSGQEDLKKLASQLTQLGIAVDNQNPDQLKNNIIARLNLVREKGQADRDAQRSTLFKGAIRTGLGALVASVLFFTMWRTTDWTRKRPKA